MRTQHREERPDRTELLRRRGLVGLPPASTHHVQPRLGETRPELRARSRPRWPYAGAVELIDVLRGRWLYLAIAAPVLAGVVALMVLSSMAEQRFVATTTVRVPQTVDDSNVASLRTLLEDFSNAFESRGVAEATAEATGRSTESLLRSVNASPAGDSSDVLVSLEGSSSADAVEEQLLELSRAALTSITETGLDQAQLSLSAAERQLEETLVELQEIEAEAGTTDILNEYRQRSADVQALRTEIARAFDSAALQDALQAAGAA